MSGWISSGIPGDILNAYKFTEPIENEAACSRFWGFIKKFNHHEEYYTVMNLQEKRITDLYGLGTWLGYAEPAVGGEAGVPLNYIAQYVHPLLRVWYECFLNAAIIRFTEIETEYLASRIVINFPLRHEKLGYVLVKQMVMPYGRTSRGKIVSLISSFSLFGQFRNEEMSVKFYKGEKEDASVGWNAVEAKILKAVKFKKQCPKLTRKHHDILRIIREFHLEGTTPTAELIARKRLGKFEVIDGEKIKNMNEDLKEMKLRLNNFLEVGPLLKKTPSADLAHFLKNEDALTVISFYAQSGLSRLIDPLRGL